MTLLLFALVLPASAATVRVAAEGGDATTIAEADALLASGDTLLLAAGTHEGCLRLDGRDLVIRGEGLETTHWVAGDCSEQLRARDGESVSLEGLSLSHPGGRVVALLGGVLDATDLRIHDSGDPTLDGAGIWARSATVTVRRAEFSGNQGRLGAALYPWDGGTLVVEESVFTDNTAAEQGGALYANGGVAGSIVDTVFSGNSSAEVSGAVGWHLGSLQLSGVRFENNVAQSNGGALYAHHSTETVVLENMEFVGNVASEGRGGALYGAYGTLFQLDGIVFADNAAVEGADLALVDGALELQDAVSTGALAERGGLLWLGPGVPAGLVRVAVCGAAAEGAVASSAGALSVQNLVGSALEGTAFALAGGTAELSWLGLSELSGGVLDARLGTASLDQSVMVAVGGTALLGSVATGWNDWWDVAEVGAPLAGSSFSMDPRWAGGDCGLRLALPAADSPLVDAGDPAELDPDGSRADVGPWGGPESPMVDGDGDGAWTVQDCDDDNAARHPGAADLPGDGIDQDCDGEDAEDGGAGDDGAGEDSGTSGSAIEEDNGVEAPANGEDDTEIQGRGCAAKQAGVPLFLPLLWLLSIGRRTRYPRR